MGPIDRWPFQLDVEAAGPAGTWAVTCRVPGADLPEACTRLALACEFFSGLERRGAFRSSTPSLGRADAAVVETSSAVNVDRDEVMSRGGCGDPDVRAWGVLANLVERLLPEATRVTIVVPAQPGAFRLAPGVYPPASDDLPFPVSDESQDRNLEVRIDFLHPLAPDQRTQIEEALSDWWYASSLGAFREADQPASESSALPPESVEWESAPFRSRSKSCVPAPRS
jgi:hypothetical protein